jgi:hypothetical protein
VTLALEFVTLTPNSFARAMMSIRFRAETACAILPYMVSAFFKYNFDEGIDVLGGVCAVVHEEEVNFADVVDEESLMAGWHHMAGLLVGAVTDLRGCWSVFVHSSHLVLSAFQSLYSQLSLPNPQMETLSSL